jgi:16S rRNA (uracil1498-N3)-methyltransferase
MTARESKGPRLFVSTGRFGIAQDMGDTKTLSPSDSHYIRDVLRLQVGDHLELGDSESGVVAITTIIQIQPNVSVTVGSILEENDHNAPHTTLLCALLKGQKNDLICDWATELGCARIIFWLSARSIVRLDSEKDRVHKEMRLSKIARSAAQQSRQARPPEVRVTLSLSEALKAVASGTSSQVLKLACSLQERAEPIRTVINQQPHPVEYIFAVGPEGDFSPDEENSLLENGFHRVSLGHRTLRSELAVVTALSSRPTH